MSCIHTSKYQKEFMDQMIVESVHTLVEHSAPRPQESTRRMSLVDLGKRLLEAAKRGETDTVRALMSNGAPFTTDWLGTSPLHFSAQYGHLETAEVLLRAGISRDARTKVDRTPLHVASQEGHAAIVQLLLNSNADIDAKDMLKMTPLHWATEKGHIAIIGVLIKNGADITLSDKFCRTPVDIALANGRPDVAQLLQLHQESTGGAVLEEGITMETPETLVTETVSTSEAVDGLVIDTDKLIKAEPDDGTEQSSTSVLATLAALAEATAPNSGNQATTSEAMSWLESQGITMISGDGSLITSAVESGQTITLTEAGKIALNQLINQQEASIEEEVTEEATAGMDVAGEITEETIVQQGEDGEEQSVITIVTAGDDDDQQTSQILVEQVIPSMGDEEGENLVIEETTSSLVPELDTAHEAQELVEGEEEDINLPDQLEEAEVTEELEGEQVTEELEGSQVTEELEGSQVTEELEESQVTEEETQEEEAQEDTSLSQESQEEVVLEQTDP